MNTLPADAVLTGLMYLLLTLSGLCFYFCARRYCDVKFSLALASVYMLMPYHLPYEILVRSALSEFLAYIWLPVIFSCIRKDMFTTKRYLVGYSLAYAGLILSHLPSALITSPFIGIYCLYLIWGDKHARISYIMRFVGLSILSIGLASIYLVPALSMLGYMNIGGLKYFDFNGSFIDNFFYTSGDGALITLFVFAVAQFVFTSIIFISSYSHSFYGSKHTSLFLYCLTAFLFFMMTSYSTFIWQIFPFMKSIQFPWRLLVLSDFFTVFSFAYYLCHEHNKESKKQLMTLLLSYCLLMYGMLQFAAYNKPVELLTNMSYGQKTQLQSKVPNPEHIPKNDFYTPPSLPADIKIEPRDIVSIVKGNGSVTLKEHEPRQAIFLIENPSTPVDVEFRQFMFYNWRIKNFDSGLDVTEAYALRAAAPYGQIQFSVPAGKHEIQIVLEKNIYEYTGEFLSALSLCILLLWGLIIGRKKLKNLSTI